MTGPTSRTTPTRSTRDRRRRARAVPAGAAPSAHSDERVRAPRRRRDRRCRWPTGRPTPWSSAWSCARSTRRAALAEARRVLRPGGELRFLEHVRAHEPGWTAGCSALLDATVWPRLFGGCHVGRDTAGAIEPAGFTVTELERFSFPEGARGPSVLGDHRPRRTPPEPPPRSARSETPAGPDRYDGRRAQWRLCGPIPTPSPSQGVVRVSLHRQDPAHRRGQDPPPARSRSPRRSTPSRTTSSR